jgi:FkbM family methyltransferase
VHQNNTIGDSRIIKENGAWEGANDNNVIKALTRFPEATFLDLGCNIGMYSLVVAALGREVVAVDADARNLELVRKSLELMDKQSTTRLIYNFVSDGYETLYPHTPDPSNPGATAMKSLDQVEQENLTITLPPVDSVKLLDILDIIPSKTIILKIDIEGYECKVLQPEIIQNKVGKFIPYIFMEWIRIHENCPDFNNWIENFKLGGYILFDPGTMKKIKIEEVSIELLWVHQSVMPLD